MPAAHAELGRWPVAARHSPSPSPCSPRGCRRRAWAPTPARSSCRASSAAASRCSPARAMTMLPALIVLAAGRVDDRQPGRRRRCCCRSASRSRSCPLAAGRPPRGHHGRAGQPAAHHGRDGIVRHLDHRPQPRAAAANSVHLEPIMTEQQPHRPADRPAPPGHRPARLELARLHRGVRRTADRPALLRVAGRPNSRAAGRRLQIDDASSRRPGRRAAVLRPQLRRPARTSPSLTEEDVGAARPDADVSVLAPMLLTLRDALRAPVINPRETFSVGAAQDADGAAEASPSLGPPPLRRRS